MRRRTFVRSSLFAMTAPALARHQGTNPLFREAPRFPQDLSALTGDGKRITLTGKAIADLRASLRGPVLLAGNDGYEQARQILNPSFNKHPALIAQPTGAADIRTAVNFARDNGGLLLAVKCGGHSHSGQSTCDGGMVIDLSRFRNVWVDPAARRARVTGGTLLGQVDHETMAHGLVTTMGTVSHTGAGGLVTGGGFGRLGRRYGLSIDNLISADVVTADGELRRASAEENPDLFWGIRGGGGNFGIVTSFEFRLHPMQRRVVGGIMAFPFARARDILDVYAEVGQKGPDELEVGFMFMRPPGGAPAVAAIAVCYCGLEANAERALAPIRKLGTPISDQVRAIDYVALQKSGDVDDPRATGTYLKSGFIADMPAGLASAIIDGLEGDPARQTQVFSQLSGGAINRVAPDATAFAQRDIMGNLLSSVGWKQGDDPTEHIKWIKQYWARIEPFTRGFYVNDLETDHTNSAVSANYRSNHNRLVTIKNKYDPRNLFRLNANVKPTV
ncbi:MAG: FAD-binding oxidoreductase [Gemmatimonadetes bacterium]|nr:FAD-binding oxidoreductase [Gemmatimonadota bacterium]